MQEQAERIGFKSEPRCRSQWEAICSVPEKLQQTQPQFRTSVQVTPPELNHKLAQPLSWENRTWQHRYNKRTSVEGSYVKGSYGNRMNV